MCCLRQSIQCFNSRSPSGERRFLQPAECSPCGFNSRSPSGERHSFISCFISSDSFNSRSPSGERLAVEIKSVFIIEFQLTLPEWGATPTTSPKEVIIEGFNSRSPSGERQSCISFLCVAPVSTHAPRVGSDVFFQPIFIVRFRFQLTLPEWGATGSSAFQAGS